MDQIWVSEIIPATRTQEASRIVVSKHTNLNSGLCFSYCTHIEVLPKGRPAFKVSGIYDLTLDDAMVNAANRFHTL